jgi:hypothetical protein
LSGFLSLVIEKKFQVRLDECPELASLGIERGNVIPPLEIRKVKLEKVFGVVMIKSAPSDAFVDRVSVYAENLAEILQEAQLRCGSSADNAVTRGRKEI